MELWDIIEKEGLENYQKQAALARYSTIVIIGVTKAGKTSLIHSFLDKVDEPKPSLPIEYTYVRKTNKYMMKDVAYIWDVEMSQLNFITQLIQGENLTEISVLLVVDLVQPHAMWNIFYQMEKFHDKMKHDTCTKVNYGIIGMKYDLYEELSNEKKVVICRLLKHYTTVIEASLIFCSKNDRTTMKVARDLFSHLAFNTKFSHQLKFDTNNPIIIPKGRENKTEIRSLQEAFQAQFGRMPEKSDSSEVDDPAEDPNYANEVIDNQRKKMLSKIFADQKMDL